MKTWKAITTALGCAVLAWGVWVFAAKEPAHDHDHDHDHDVSKKTTAPATTKAAHKHDHDEHAGHKHGEEAHSDEVTLTAEAIRRYGIKLEPASKRVLLPTFVAPARVAFNAEAMAHVGSAVKGRAVELKARVGKTVKKGDELLVIESPELGEAQSDFLQKRTGALVAEAAVEPLKQAYERAKKLHHENQGISLGEAQKREAELKAAEGSVLTQKAAQTAALNTLVLLGMDPGQISELEQGGRLMPRHVVRAPIGGQVISREVTQGELVTPEKEALLVIANMDVLWVLADVPEARLSQIAEGSEARVTLAAAANQTLTGKIAHIAAALDAETRTATVRIEVPNGGGVLRPGMFAKVELSAANEAAAAEPVLAVPDQAIQTVEGGPAVFVPVEGEENTFAKRAIKVGKVVGGYVPVLSGLKEGEPIVTGGTFILKAELGKGEAGHGHDH